jgi:hypothetical protein
VLVSANAAAEIESPKPIIKGYRGAPTARAAFVAMPMQLNPAIIRARSHCLFMLFRRESRLQE